MTSSPPQDSQTTPLMRPFSEAWSLPPTLLELTSGDNELLAVVVDLFSTDTAARMQQVRSALAVSEFSLIQEQAHTITGSARQVGADAVADACQELENAANRKEALHVAAGVNSVQEVPDEIRRAMASHCRGRLGYPSVTPSI
jgi:HPt (histidine-containing phosphotransfer) domain-containing protein